MGIVASQYPSPRGCWACEVLPHACNIGVFQYGENNPTTINTFTINLRTLMKVVMLLSTAIFGGIFHKQCQWLGWRVWWHALALVTHKDYLTPGICSPIKPAAMEKLMSFCAKIPHSQVIITDTYMLILPWWVNPWCAGPIYLGST